MQGYVQGNTAGYFNQQQQQARRPIPRFDMDLKDLFSDDETDKRSFSRVSNQVNAMRPPPTPSRGEIQQQLQQPFTGDLKISPQLRHHQPQQTIFFGQSPNIPSPNQQSSFNNNDSNNSANNNDNAPPLSSPPISQSPTHQNAVPSPYQMPNSLAYNAYAQNLSSSTNTTTSSYPDIGGFNDLDFLDSFPLSGMGSSNGAAAGGGGIGDNHGLQDVGIGFGMGFGDGTHDWSDGNGFDLFDGFFFGPGGTGM